MHSPSAASNDAATYKRPEPLRRGGWAIIETHVRGRREGIVFGLFGGAAVFARQRDPSQTAGGKRLAAQGRQRETRSRRDHQSRCRRARTTSLC